MSLKANNTIKMKGVLVHGPSGIGKTLMIREVLSDMKVPVLVLHPKDLVAE